MEETFTFSNFIFDYNSGELTDTSNKKDKKVIRLTPQSAKLLQFLIKNYPNLVSKKEIKSLLWPNVEVDFDNSLHFCIRQIRIALQDDVSNPKYVETIPRRGYRWLVKVKQKKENKSIIQLFLAISLLIIASIGVNHYISNKNKVREEGTIQKQTNIRLVIMPLQPPDTSNFFYGNMIAYDLLSLFVKMKGLEVIGPTTTQNVNQENLYKFLDSSNADFIINGKFSRSEHESSLLVELIRASDKAHVWVTSFDNNTSSDHITREIYSEFSERMVRFNETMYDNK